MEVGMEVNGCNNYSLEEQAELDCRFEDEINELKRAEKEAERYIFVCKKKIEEYQRKVEMAEKRINERTENVKNNIYNFLNNAFEAGKISKESVKESKTQTTYVIPSAKFIFKKEKEKIIKTDDSKLIYFFEKNKMEDYIKIEKSPKWGDFKKKLKISNGKIINEDGEIIKIDGIEIKTEEPDFEIKYL